MRVDNEVKRIIAVNRFKEIDANILLEIQQLVDLLSDICRTPIVTVTLLDHDVQWIKASKGINLTQTCRNLSLCNYTIQQTGVLIVNDLMADSRYKSNPFVTDNPHLRFYAGAPLITHDNYAIGSLCVVGKKPGKLNELQINSLKTFSRQITNLIELNRNCKIMQERQGKIIARLPIDTNSELKLKALFDSSADVHMLVNRNFEILAFNRSAVVFVKKIYKHKLALGDCVLDITDKKILNQFKKYFNIALSDRSIKREWLLMAGTPRQCWHITNFTPVKNLDGAVIGVALNSTDISDRKKQEDHINIQNEALHRIAIIQSHEIRRPVATLLGIMDLIRMENVSFKYYDIMEHTVNELDEKICDIVKESEQMLNIRQIPSVA